MPRCTRTQTHSTVPSRRSRRFRRSGRHSSLATPAVAATRPVALGRPRGIIGASAWSVTWPRDGRPGPLGQHEPALQPLVEPAGQGLPLRERDQLPLFPGPHPAVRVPAVDLDMIVHPQSKTGTSHGRADQCSSARASRRTRQCQASPSPRPRCQARPGSPHGGRTPVPDLQVQAAEQGRQPGSRFHPPLRRSPPARRAPARAAARARRRHVPRHTRGFRARTASIAAAPAESVRYRPGRAARPGSLRTDSGSDSGPSS